MSEDILNAAIFVTVEPKKRNDYDKLLSALDTLAKKFAPVFVRPAPNPFKITIYGMSDGQLEMILHELKPYYYVEAVAGRLQVDYKETIKKTVVEEAKLSRQGSGTVWAKEFGHCIIQLEPLPRGTGFQFLDQDREGRLPKKFVPIVEEGIKLTLFNRGKMKFPMTDVKVSLLGGSHDPHDSTETAFRSAGAMAAHAARLQAKPVILEPIMNYEVRVPENFMGDVIGDLNSRRATIQDMGDTTDIANKAIPRKFIKCQVPLAEIIGHGKTLRAITQGTAATTTDLKPQLWSEVDPKRVQAITDPHGTDEPPTSSAGRPVLPIRPRPGISGSGKRIPPPNE